MLQDELKEALTVIGFRHARKPIFNEVYNTCNWYAYRKISQTFVNCECNDKPPSLIIEPSYMTVNGRAHDTCEVIITGERDNVWFQLKAYGIKASELIERLPKVEAALVAAWNNLITGV